MRRPVREGHKPNGGRARAGEVGLCRSTCEPTEQGKATSCGGRGGKGAAGGEHRSTAHAPDSEQGRCMFQRLAVCVKSTAVGVAPTPSILQKSRMRRRARTDLCGGRSVMTVPTATTTFSASISFRQFLPVFGDGVRMRVRRVGPSADADGPFASGQLETCVDGILLRLCHLDTRHCHWLVVVSGHDICGTRAVEKRRDSGKLDAGLRRHLRHLCPA